MNKKQYERKVRLINRLVDTYFRIAPENKSFEMVCRFTEWLDNGEFEEEKDAALFRKFNEILDEEALVHHSSIGRGMKPEQSRMIN